MSEQDAKEPADPHQVFIDLLEESGFFQQINNLEESLKTVSAELKTFGDNAAQRMEETENLAAHVLAIEAILAVILKAHPIEAEALEAEVRDRTAALAGTEDGSPTVLALARDIVAKSQAAAKG